MAEWLLERGIGETRAILVEGGAIIEMRIERHDAHARPGDVWDTRLTTRLTARRGIVVLDDEEAILEPLPPALAEGALCRVEVVREAIPERGRPRLAKVRAEGSAGTTPGRVTRAPGLADALPSARDAGLVGSDTFEAAGWSEALDAAASGCTAFPGGLLTITPTPAMTTIDVDGDMPLAELALAGAAAAAAAIRKFDIGGSIGIDLPTVGDRSVRMAAAEIFDASLPQPFERTAVNGFGFIQIVRPRRRTSIIELVQGSPVETAALSLLRRAERSAGAGPRVLTAAPRVAAWLRRHAAYTAELELRLGAAVSIVDDAQLTLAGGHVHGAQIR